MTTLRILGCRITTSLNRSFTRQYTTCLRSRCGQLHIPQAPLQACFRPSQSHRATVPLHGIRWLHTTPSNPHDEKPPEKKIRILPKLRAVTTHENIYTLPNILTFTRLLCAPAVGYLIINGSHTLAASLFIYAGVTDLVDGYIARRYKLQTVVGSVIDPMADKALMTIAIVCLAIKGALPLSLATIVLGRDVSLALAAIYYRFASLPPPKTFARYWDFSLPSAEVHPTFASKVNTSLQLALVGSAILLPLVTSWGTWQNSVDMTMTAFQAVVASTTLWSGASYAWRKDVVKILGDDEVLKRKQGHRGRLVIGISYAAFVAIAAWLFQKEMQAKQKEEEK